MIASKAYHKEELWDGAINHRFYRTPEWKTDYTPGTPEHDILSIMKEGGSFSFASVENGRTSLIGPGEGVDSPINLAGLLRGPALAVNAGYFLHWNFFFLEHEKGPLMREGKYGYLIGESSLPREHIDFSQRYESLMSRRDFSDGTFLTVGPSLVNALSLPKPTFKELNTSKGAFSYFSTNHEGNKIESVVYQARKIWDDRYREAQALRAGGVGPSMEVEAGYLTMVGQKIAVDENGEILFFAAAAPGNEWVRCKWHRVPGGLSHVNEPNERSGMSIHANKQVVHYAYNSQRSLGVTMNEFRTLIIAATRLLGLDFSEINENDVWANDGGPSVIRLLVNASGSINVIAAGGLAVQTYPLELRQMVLRPVPNMIVITGGATE